MLVERDGDPDFVKVLDFGIAKVPVGELRAVERRRQPAAIGQVLTQLGMVYGTPEYMAPEQALGQEVDARADLYALGVMLFEMLTGARPFEAESKVALLGMKVTSDPPPLASKNPSVRVGEVVEATVRRLLDKEASARFQTAGECSRRSSRAASAKRAPRPHRAPAIQRRQHPRVARYRASLASVPRGGTLALDELKTAQLEHTPAPDASKGWSSNFQSRFASLTPGGPAASLLVRGALAAVLPIVSWWPSVFDSRFGGASAPKGPGPFGQRQCSPFSRGFSSHPRPRPKSSGGRVASGVAPLENLSTTFPEDPAVWRALVRLIHQREARRRRDGRGEQVGRAQRSRAKTTTKSRKP